MPEAVVRPASAEEIAAIMKLSVETVKSQIYQARQRLRSELDHPMADENS